MKKNQTLDQTINCHLKCLKTFCLNFQDNLDLWFIPEWIVFTISGYALMKLPNHTARTPGTPRCSLHRSLMLCTAKFWGGNAAAAAAAAAAATLYKGATKEPGPRRWRRRTRWRQNSPARRRTWRRPPPSTFAYGLYPKQQLDAGHRLRRMCAVVLHQIPIFSYILISWNHVVSRSMMVSRKLEFPK